MRGTVPNVIYGLIDTRPHRFGELRYIGKSSSGMQRPRTYLSLSATKRRGHVANWLKALRAVGCLPEIEIIEIVDTAECLNSAEMYWIALMRFAGCDLTNLTAGGEGFSGYHRKLSKEHRARIGDGHRGRPKSDTQKRKTSEALMGHTQPESVKAKISETKLSQKIKATQEQREAARVRGTGKVHTSESRRKMSMHKKSEEHIANLRLAWIKRKSLKDANKSVPCYILLP